MAASSIPQTVSRGQIPVRAKGDSRCSVHRNKEVLLYCSECDILICLTCSISTHSGHTLEELLDITPQKKEVLQGFINDTENDKLVRLKREIESIEDKLTENNGNFKKLGQQVKQQGEVCKKQIDVLTDKFVSVCDKLAEENKDLLLKYREELQQRYKSLDEQSKECKLVLQSGTPVQVYDVTSSISGDSPKLLEEPVLCEVEFHPCKAVNDQLRKVMGSFTTSVDQHGRETSFKDISSLASAEEFLDQSIVQTQFKSPLKCSSLFPASSGIWFMDCDSTELIQLNFKGKVKQKIKNASEVKSIAVSPKTDQVWFCCEASTFISSKRPEAKSSVERFKVPFFPTCLCVTKEDHVVVGSPENMSIYTISGEVLFTFPVEENLRDLSCPRPGCIAQCPLTGCLAVIYHYKSDEGIRGGTVLVYDQTRKLKFVYDGEQGADRKSTFIPQYVVFDSRGNLVISTRYRIDLISGTGQYIKTLHKDWRVGAVGILANDVLLVAFVIAEKRGMFAEEINSEITTIQYYKN